MKNNTKKIFILGLFLFSFLGLAKGPVRPTKSSHMLYELNIGAAEGSYYTTKSVLSLYDEPKNGAPAVFQVPLINEKRKRPGAFYKLFDDGSAIFYSTGISSKEKIGDFYKVFYEGDYYWANKSDFVRVVNIEEFAAHPLGIYLSVYETSFYNKPNGNKIKLPSGIDDFLKGTGYKHVTFDVAEYKWVQDKLWVKIKTAENFCGSNRHFKGKVDAWIHPFSKEGKPLFVYARKGC